MNKYIRIILLHYLIVQCLSDTLDVGGHDGGHGGGGGHEGGGHGGGHGGGGHGGGHHKHEPLKAVPDIHSYGKIQYPKLKLIELGEYSKGKVPEKVIKISKTYAIKVPHPYPVKIKHDVPVPYPVAHPYPVSVPKIVKVPHPVPVEVIKKVEIPVHHHHSSGGGGGNDYSSSHDFSVGLHQDVSASVGYGDSENHGGSAADNGNVQLVHFRYTDSFGTQHQSQPEQHPEGAQYQHNYAAFPATGDVQPKQDFGPPEASSYHGSQDGGSGYSIHTVSMNIPEPEHQHQSGADAGGESSGPQLMHGEEHR